MANDCLVTKLKSVVNNDNLKVLGSLKLSCSSASATKLKVKSTKAQKVKVLEGLVTISGQNVSEFTIPANTVYTVYSDVSNKVVLLFTDKYSLISLHDEYGPADFDLEDLEYSEGITSLEFAYDNYGITGNLSSLENLTSLTSIIFTTSKVVGNISSLSGLTNLVNIDIVRSYKILGDIESFGTLTSLNILKLGNTGVGGTLESLVKAQVGNGRTSGSIEMGYLRYSNITFNGVKPNDNNATLTWEPHSGDATKTDITYNGVSVTIDNE